MVLPRGCCGNLRRNSVVESRDGALSGILLKSAAAELCCGILLCKRKETNDPMCYF